MHKPILEIKEGAARVGSVQALHPISFSLSQGFRLGIAGETGSGKSTLLKALAGLQNLSQGSVWWKGTRVEEPWEKLVPGHPSIAYLSQHFELRNNYRVGEILSYAEKISEVAAAEIYRICQVDHLLQRKTDQLSGGERQRIAMARLLVGAPTVFLLDEPFSNLDNLHKQTMKQVLKDLGESRSITWVLVSHDPADLLSWADEMLILKDGRKVQQGPPMEIYNRPVDEYTAGLLGHYTVLSAAAWKNLSGQDREQGIIVRPSAFELEGSVNTGRGIKALVESSEFMGYGFLLTLRLITGDQIKILHHSLIEPGQEVAVRLR
ncbi:MAG TPA: ABC transporter ATP-binding protein [Flavihumibacter sp.]|jgi:ABC-type sugar transport system ATPase subunit